MTQQKHSPLPWELVSNESEGIVIYCTDKSHLKTSRLMGNYRGVVVCDFDNAVGSYLARRYAIPEANANADFIVRAVNKHDNLVLHLRNVCNSVDSISFDARKGKALEFLANIEEK